MTHTTPNERGARNSGAENAIAQLWPVGEAQRRPLLHLIDGGVLSYADAAAQAAQIAHVLIASGVRPGDRVAVQVEKSVAAILLYFAVLRAGAVYLPLNTAYTRAELEYFIADAEPAVIVCRPESAEAVSAAAAAGLAAGGGVQAACILTLGGQGEGSLLAAARVQPGEFDDVPRSAGDLAAILYTSGTMGRSKGAMLTHANLVSNALVLRDFWHYTSNDVLLHALPIFHIHGLFVAVNVTLAAGAAMILLPRFEADSIFRFLPAATVMMGVPTFYVRLLRDERLTRGSTEHMRLFVSGSAPLLSETHRGWQQRTGHAILERYGMSETGMNTSNPYDGERIAGTVGRPLPGVSVRITNLQTGGPRSAEEAGMIEVCGPNVFAGYWRQPERTRAEFRDDGFFITGDIGKFDARGYLHIVGRAKDLIISGGYNVYPKEIESEIDALPGVIESAVIGVPHPDFGEGVTAVVVATGDTANDTVALAEGAVVSRLKARLAAYKIPKRVLFVDELPRNAMGKVQKNLLRQRFADLYGA
jgi:malonyl-CoA/methylmalonyl-CoA synthetase